MGLETYIEDGYLRAIHEVKAICDVDKVNAIDGDPVYDTFKFQRRPAILLDDRNIVKALMQHLARAHQIGGGDGAADLRGEHDRADKPDIIGQHQVQTFGKAIRILGGIDARLDPVNPGFQRR